MKAFALSDLPASLQRQALALLNPGPFSRDFASKQHPQGEPKTIAEARDRLRQNKTGMNKTEAAFYEHLQANNSEALVLPQSITLRLANGVRYTPDFITVRKARSTISAVYCEAYEVKGHMRDDAAVKLKVAATAYPWISFRLVTRGKRGTWNIQNIIS